MVSILVIDLKDSNEDIVEEILDFLSKKRHCKICGTSRSAFPDKTEKDILSFPGLEIRLNEQTVIRNGVPVHLSHYEFFTLYYLARHPKWVFTKKQIYEAVWKQPGENCEAAVSSVISQIRKKLNSEGGKEGYIKTVINSGYKFE